MNLASTIALIGLAAASGAAASPVPPVPPGATLQATDGVAFDAGGFSVDIQATEAVMGVRGRDDGGSNRGAAYVYRRGGDGWSQVQKLTPTAPQNGEEFGHAVGLASAALVIGAPKSDRDGVDAGSAWVFESNGVSWGEVARLSLPGAGQGSLFGCSVDLDRSSATGALIVGARRALAGGVRAGSAVIFRKSPSGWLFEALLEPPAFSTENDDFGQSVHLFADWAFVGAPGEDQDGVNAGAVYVFRRIDGAWSLQQRLGSPSPVELGEFGCSIGFNGDSLAIGAYREDGAVARCGRVHLFRFTKGSWGLESSVVSPNPVEFGEFGCSVSIQGAALAVGAQREFGSAQSSGHAVLYKRLLGVWQPVARSVSTSTASDQFVGAAVAMDGLQLLCGAPLASPAGQYQGAAFVTDLSADCNDDGVPDLAELAAGAPDCDGNRIPDACDIAQGARDSNANGIPDACEQRECVADITGNGMVNAADLAELLSSWGVVGSSADLTGDGVVAADDITLVLSAWGPCP